MATSIPTKSCVVTVRDIFSLLSSKQDKWKSIGEALSFSESELDSINKHSPDDPADCLKQVLTKWLESDPRTWADLVDALEDGSLDLKHILVQIENRYMSEGYDFHKIRRGALCINDWKESIHDGTVCEDATLYSTSCTEEKPVNLALPDESRVKDFRCESELASKTNIVVNLFFELFVASMKAIKTSSVTVQKLFAFLDQVINVHAFENCYTVDDFFQQLYSHVSWYNYEILGMIIKQFGSDCTQQLFTNYERTFHDMLRQRKISEMSPDVYHKARKKYGNPSVVENNWKKLGVKVDYEWDTFLVNDIKALRNKIASVFEVEEQALYLLRVSDGCVFLEFGVPEFVSEQIKLTELMAHNYVCLVETNVIEIQCDAELVVNRDMLYLNKTLESWYLSYSSVITVDDNDE